MYSSIANNSFSYLLTLDDIRRNLPEKLRPSWVKITTITMVSKIGHSVDIKKLRTVFEMIGSYKMKRASSKTEGFEWKLKPTTFYNQVTLTYNDTYSTKSVKVFPNGSVQVAGCCSVPYFNCILHTHFYKYKQYIYKSVIQTGLEPVTLACLV